MQEVLKWAKEEIKYFRAIVKSYAFEKTRFKEESKKLTKNISKVTKD